MPLIPSWPDAFLFVIFFIVLRVSRFLVLYSSYWLTIRFFYCVLFDFHCLMRGVLILLYLVGQFSSCRLLGGRIGFCFFGMFYFACIIVSYIGISWVCLQYFWLISSHLLIDWPDTVALLRFFQYIVSLRFISLSLFSVFPCFLGSFLIYFSRLISQPDFACLFPFDVFISMLSL